MASLIRRGGLSAHYQLHITLLMLPTKNCKSAFEFVKVIIRNIVSFFHVGYNKNGIYDNVIITVRQHYIVMSKFWKQILHVF